MFGLFDFGRPDAQTPITREQRFEEHAKDLIYDGYSRREAGVRLSLAEAGATHEEIEKALKLAGYDE